MYFYMKRFFIACLCLLVIAGLTVYYLYKSPALDISSEQYVKLGDKDNLETLSSKLESECGLKYPFIFKAIARKMNLERWMKRGRFTVKPGMTMVDVVRVFRAGKMQTVNLVLRPNATLEAFAEKCGEKLEPDAQDYMFLLNDSAFLDSMGFSRETVYALLLPDTYNVFWHTQADELLQRLFKEYQKYWNEDRTAKAESRGLSPIQVSILASIVDKETNKVDEMPLVAGLYLNRLKTGMLLQADPTVIYALNKTGIHDVHRVRFKDLGINSPYNTYLHKGLPPGPLCVPSKQAIEAVLNAGEHNYIYMCAREDFSGYHNFTSDYDEHCLNAKRFKAELDRREIK